MRKLKSFFLLLAFLSAVAFLFAGCSTPHQLSTSVVPNTGGTINPSAGTFEGKVTLIANPAQYYKFIGWAGDASGNTNPLTVNMNSNKQIVAQFSKITYDIQIKSNPSDGGMVRPDSGTYEAGTRVNITATPANGYRFAQWGTDASGSTNPLSILVDKDMDITGNFIKQYKLAVSADPTSGTVSPNGGVYDAGAPVNLTAIPAFPYAFKNWVGADNNSINPTNVTMNADKSVSVTFVQLTKKTAVQKNNDGQKYSVGNVPIDLKQFEWVEGAIDCGTFPRVHVYIQGPDGTNIKDFGSIGQANFRIMAQISGIYSIIVEPNAVYGAFWNIGYTVYGLQ
jgi:hypothetical protein